MAFPFSTLFPIEKYLFFCFAGMEQIRSQNWDFWLRMYFLARLFIQYYLLMNEPGF